MKTLNEVRDEVGELFPQQSVSVSAAAWLHRHVDGPNRYVIYTVGIHREIGEGLEFHENFDTLEMLLVGVRQHWAGKWNPKAMDGPVVAEAQ